MRLRTPARTDRVAAKDPVAPRAGLPTRLAHPTRQDRRPRAAAAHARCDRTRPKTNRDAAFHPCADSSVADTHRHRTHCKSNYKWVGLHYTRLFAGHRDALKLRSGNRRLAPPRACFATEIHLKKCSKQTTAEVGLTVRLAMGILRGVWCASYRQRAFRSLVYRRSTRADSGIWRGACICLAAARRFSTLARYSLRLPVLAPHDRLLRLRILVACGQNPEHSKDG